MSYELNAWLGRAIVKQALPRCTYESLRGAANTEKDGYRFPAGCFRMTIVSDKLDFVIKTGFNKAGVIQCEREVENFTRAARYGYANKFAAFLGSFTYNHHTFYMFEKIDGIGSGWARYVRAFKNEDPDFIHYLVWNDLDADLHRNNYGFRDGEPVITDYAGVEESDWWLT